MKAGIKDRFTSTLRATALRAVTAAYSSLVGQSALPSVDENVQLRDAIEASPVGMLMIDARGRIVLVNAEIERLFGYARDELIERDVELLVPAAVRARHVEHRLVFAQHPKQRSMGGGRALHGVRKDGSEFALEIGLSPLRTSSGLFTLASVIDISERLRTEAKLEHLLNQQRTLNAELEKRVEERTIALRSSVSDLQTRERWFSTTMRSIADAVVSVDREGAIDFMNPAAERLLGASFAAAKGRAANAVIRISSRDGGAAEQGPLERALREQRVVLLTEATLEGSGEPLLIADSAAPVVDKGELLGAVMVFRDVTGERAAQKQLAVAERMASLGTLSAGVAHEINNPLFVVMANADFVLEQIEAFASPIDRSALDEAVKAQGDLLSAAARIRRIVTDLKTFSRAEAGTGTCDLHEAVAWAVRSTAHEFRSCATVLVENARVPTIAADETRVGQILVNLLLNAAQAIPPGSPETNKVVVRTRTGPEGNALIDISDTGPGMEPSVVARIFEPFFTTKPVGVGTGLGLAICRGLVTALGGELTVESQVGVGSTFHVSLPAASPAHEATHPPAPAIDRSRARVLLVDDDELVLHAMARSLGSHTVVRMSKPKKALELLAQDREFDIIFCDMLMPEMSGVQFFDGLAQYDPSMARRIVFVTGGVAGQPMLDALARLPNRSLQKPFAPGELEAAVQRALSERRQQ